MGLATGLCLSSGVVALLSASLTDQQVLEWGWRIAFLISVVLVGVALYIRLHILETPDFQKAKDSGKTADKTLPIVKVCRNHPGNIALGVGARWIDGVFFNVLAVFVISYLVQYISIERTQALTIVMIAALLMCPFILIAGRLADRYGRGMVYGVSSLLCGLSIFPSFWLMEGSGGSLFLIALAIIIPISVFYAGVFGPEAALFSDLFPPDVRYTGISIVYQFPGFLVAGIVPGLCTFLINWNEGDPLYVCLFTLLAAVTSALSAFAIQRKSHGGGPVHRHAGSMGSGTDPSRIFKGKIGAGHMGAEQVTVQNLDVVSVDPEFNLIAVCGAVPGPKGGIVYLKSTAKTIREKKGEAGTSVNPQKASARANPQKASARNR